MDTSVGQLIGPDMVRDAIHVAVAPVIAAEHLRPGDHVGLTVNEDDTVGLRPPFIGVVDPFLKTAVRPGERFYLFLYPQTVTGMRHHWQHPAFDGGAAKPVSTPPAIRRRDAKCGRLG